MEVIDNDTIVSVIASDARSEAISELLTDCFQENVLNHEE